MASTIHGLSDEEIKSMRAQYEIKMEEYYANRVFNGPWCEKFMCYVKKMLTSSQLPVFDLELFDKYVKGKYFITRRNTSIYKKRILARILKTPEEDLNIPVLPWEHAFDVILTNHVECGHGNVIQTMNLLKTKCFIDIPCVYYAVQLCPVCEEHAEVNDSKTRVVFNQVASLEILDMTAKPDVENKYVLIYTDEGTGLIQLRAVTDMAAIQLAMKLVEIFNDLGPPKVLRIYDTFLIYDYGLDMVNTLFKPCQITIEPSLSFSNRVENVRNLLLKWMAEEKTEHWEIGCYAVQWKINNIATLIKTPHELVFGCDMQKYFEPNDTDLMETDSIDRNESNPTHNTELDVPLKQSPIQINILDKSGTCVAAKYSSKADMIPESHCVNIYDDLIVKEEVPIANVTKHKAVKSSKTKAYFNKRLLNSKQNIKESTAGSNLPSLKSEPLDNNPEPLDSCDSDIKPETMAMEIDTLIKNEDISGTKLCSECYKEIEDESYTCIKCMNTIHSDCGEKVECDGTGDNVVCWSCENEMKVIITE